MSNARTYRLVRELGTGTFGTVYQAEMEGAGGFVKQVALKVLHPQWEADSDLARRFRDEARLLGRLYNQHIVAVDGLVRVGGRWAVVMEYVPGFDCHMVIKACRKARQTIPAPAALEIVSAVASALDSAYFHAPDGGEPLLVIHRDIKPSNIRLSEDGGLKVLDFGIAQAEFDGREAITHSIRYGSLRYMSPQRRNAEVDTPADDVYSLGAVLYELLMARPLGPGEPGWAEHTQLVHEATLRVAERLGEDAQPVVALLRDMLDHAAENRPSADEVARRARELARRLQGASLAEFASAFLPRVHELVDDPTTELSRVVTSSGPGSSDEVLTASNAPIMLPREFTDEAHDATPPVHLDILEDVPVVDTTLRGDARPARARPARASPRRMSLLPVLAGAGAGTVAVLVMVGIWVATRGPTSTDLASTTAEPSAATSESAHASTAVAAATERQVPTASAPEAPGPDTTEATAAAPEPEITQEQAVHVPDRAPAVEATAPTPAVEPEPTPIPPTPPEDPAGTSEPEATPVAPETGLEGPDLRAVKFTFAGANAIRAACVGASASGTESALVRQLRPGACTVRVRVGDTDHIVEVDIQEARGVSCSLEGDTLTCR